MATLESLYRPSTTSTTNGTTSTGTSTTSTYSSGQTLDSRYRTAPTSTSTSSSTMSNSSSLGQGTAFHCPTTGLGGRVFGQLTMLEVIDQTSSGSSLNALGRYIVAALLNARSGRTPMLNESVVRNMWNDLVNRGYYEPTAGVRWGAIEIVAYIKTTIA
jgi:hypothetical protein